MPRSFPSDLHQLETDAVWGTELHAINWATPPAPSQANPHLLLPSTLPVPPRSVSPTVPPAALVVHPPFRAFNSSQSTLIYGSPNECSSFFVLSRRIIPESATGQPLCHPLFLRRLQLTRRRH